MQRHYCSSPIQLKGLFKAATTYSTFRAQKGQLLKFDAKENLIDLQLELVESNGVYHGSLMFVCGPISCGHLITKSKIPTACTAP